MRSIREAGDQGLQWSSISLWQHRFALHAAGDVVARLRWEKTFGSLAVAETAEGSWTFKRRGFLRPSVTIRVPGADEDLATLSVHFRGEGSLLAPDGRVYQWTKASFWRSSWTWTDAGGQPLVHFEPVLLKRSAAVKLEPAALPLHDLPLLVCLGWYLMVLMADDAGAVAAAAAAG